MRRTVEIVLASEAQWAYLFVIKTGPSPTGHGRMKMADRYDVVDVQAAKVVASYRNRDRAYRYADRRDNDYGAVRYAVRPVWN